MSHKVCLDSLDDRSSLARQSSQGLLKNISGSESNLHKDCRPSTANSTSTSQLCTIKLCINNRLIDLKELVTLCNEHSTHCQAFTKNLKEKSTPYQKQQVKNKTKMPLSVRSAQSKRTNEKKRKNSISGGALFNV